MSKDAGKAKAKRVNTIRAYRQMFLTPTGDVKPDARLVLDDLYEMAHFFDGGVIDVQELAILEGARQVVRNIVRTLQIKDQELIRFLKGE